MGSTSGSQEPESDGTGRAKPKDEESRKRNFDWGRLIGSGMTAGALIYVAIVGHKVNATIERSQRKADEFALYVNRETAVNQLRGQVFSALAQHVVTKIEDKDYRKVALLAALHGNLSKFIDTRPVFTAFLKEVEGNGARHELRRLAKRVARRQADYIVAHGGSRESLELEWRSPDPSGLKEFELDGHHMGVVIEKVEVVKENPMDVENTVDVKVTLGNSTKRFSISYLDVPYMDNLFVVHEDQVHRIALLLLDMEKTDGGYRVKLDALHFPASIIMPMDMPSAQEVRKAAGTSNGEVAASAGKHAH